MKTRTVIQFLVLTFILLGGMVLSLILIWNLNLVYPKAFMLVSTPVLLYFFARYLAIFFTQNHNRVVKSKLVAIRKIIKHEQFLIFFITGSQDRVGNEKPKIFIDAHPHACDENVINFILSNAPKAFQVLKDADNIGNHGMNIIRGEAPPDDPINN